MKSQPFLELEKTERDLRLKLGPSFARLLGLAMVIVWVTILALDGIDFDRLVHLDFLMRLVTRLLG